MNELREITDLSTPSLYRIISKKEKEALVEKEIAVLLVVLEKGIDITRYTSKDQLTQVRNIAQKTPVIIRPKIERIKEPKKSTVQYE